MTINIAVDLMGNINSPYNEINAIKSFLLKQNNKNVKFFGFITMDAYNKINFKHKNVEYVICKDIIYHDEEALLAVKQKQESTIVKALKYLKDKKVDAVISSANTGAYVLASLLILGRINKIKKPALFSTFLRVNDLEKIVVGDLGAITDINPEILLQYSIMGTEISKLLFNKKDPKLALLNIGEEKTKGDKLRKEAYDYFRKNKMINFKGNIEANLVLNNNIDVIISDGFSGNILLKSYEGAISSFSYLLKNTLSKNIFTKFLCLLLMPHFKKIKKILSEESVGCAFLTGVNGIVIKTHGNATSNEIYQSLKECCKLVEGDFINNIKNGINKNIVEENDGTK